MTNSLSCRYCNKNLCAVAGVPAVAAGKEDGALGEFRNKLLSFLDISTNYEPARLISDFPFDGTNWVHTRMTNV